MRHSRLILFSFLFLFSNTVFADVTQFVFVTEPQSVSVNALSSIITVQSQDSSGTKQNASSTSSMYVTLTSSSLTGKFFTNNITRNVWVNPVTMATNTANKNFYYTDSVSGVYTIQVNIASEKGGLSVFSTSQSIFIGQPVSAGSASSTSTTISNTATSTTTTSDVSTPSVETVSNITSAHSSPVSLSNTEEKLEFEVSAGRDRLTEIGSSVIFRAVPTKFDKIPESSITYLWSFGDGTTAQGNNINHTYKFAGEYSVVVNASYSDRQAVDRLTVKVVSPDVSLGKVSGGVQINNNSKTEINLEGWSLVGNKKSFVFPKDTLIPSGKKVVFSDDVTGLSDSSTKLLNPLGKEFASYSGLTAVAFVSIVSPQAPVSTSTDLSYIQEKIDEVKNQISKISQNNILASTPISPRVLPRVTLGKKMRVPTGISTSTPTPDIGANASNTALVFQAEKQAGFVSSIFSWPIKGFNFIKHLFIEN